MGPAALISPLPPPFTYLPRIDAHDCRLLLLLPLLLLQGVPQGRFRILIWGARQGEQLPALPAHTHGICDFGTHRSLNVEDGYLYEHQVISVKRCEFEGRVLTDRECVGGISAC